MSQGIKLWACAALCQDQTEREVVGLYRGDRCLLVSRPWCAPSSVPVLQITTRRLYPLLAALISAADYHVHGGAWFGEIAIDWRAIAALSNMSQNTVSLSLQSLMRDGYIHYDPAAGRVNSTLIRIFPYHARSGVRLFQIEPSWLRGFIHQVEPRLALYEVKAEGKSLKFENLSGDRSQTAMGLKISAAPVFVPVHNDPSARDHKEEETKEDEFISRLRGVPGLDEVYRMAAGAEPKLGDKDVQSMIPSAGINGSEVASDWRKTGWSQRGVEIMSAPEISIPKAGELGVIPTWAVVGEVVGDAAAESEVSHSSLALGCVGKTARDLKDLHDHHDVGPLIPTAGIKDPGAGACGAASAPPPAAPPAANALYLRPKSERQLRQVQVDGLYELRGERVSNAARQRLTTKQISCVETYERLAGIPFCVEDMKFLDRALTLTSHVLVLRGIRDCSRFPEENPGFYIVRDGMKHILSYIEKNRMMHAKPKGKSRSAGSGMTPKIAQHIRDRKKNKLAAAPAPSPEPPVQAASGIVSEASQGVPSESPVSAEPRKETV